VQKAGHYSSGRPLMQRHLVTVNRAAYIGIAFQRGGFAGRSVESPVPEPSASSQGSLGERLVSHGERSLRLGWTWTGAEADQPHVFRLTAVALISAGVDVTVIRSGWAWHLDTRTLRQARLETKRKALEQVEFHTAPAEPPRWSACRCIGWLDSL